jgi:hypothetical protein
MPTRRKPVVDGIKFELDEPTAVPIERLFSWVIWQFPRPRKGGFSGAVHPPETQHGWYPAVIDAAGGRVLIHGHVAERFPTPEAAAKHLDKPAER